MVEHNIFCTNTWGWGNDHKDSVVVTCVPQTIQGCLGGAKGTTDGPHTYTNRSDRKRARNNKKKIKTSKFVGVRKANIDK